METLLRDTAVRVVVTVGILHELLHIVTDARRFQKPMSVSEAITLVRAYSGRTNVRVLPAEEVDLLNALELMTKLHLGRNRAADALLAAVLRRHSIRRLLTRNLRGFSCFEFLQPEDPLS